MTAEPPPLTLGLTNHIPLEEQRIVYVSSPHNKAGVLCSFFKQRNGEKCTPDECRCFLPVCTAPAYNHKLVGTSLNGSC